MTSFSAEPDPALNPKKIAVIGAGPAGCTLALEAARRGHKIDLYEKSGRIGGKIIPGSVPRGKFDFDNYRIFLENHILKADKDGVISLHLNTEATPDTLSGKGYDAIVTAIGTADSAFTLPDMDKVKTVQATQLLTNPQLLGDAEQIVVIGGGSVGCETAHWLSYEKGKKVTVVEMLPYFMDGACTANRGYLIYYMKKNGVRLLNMTKVSGFEKDAVKVTKNVHKNVPDPYTTWSPILPKNVENPLAPKISDMFEDETLKADLVVLATGGRANDKLFYELQQAKTAPELYNIGDSFAGGRVLEATRAAFRLAREI